MEVAHDAREPHRGFTACRTALIEPNQLHLIRSTQADHAFLYVDALGSDLTALRERCLRRGPAVSFAIENESALIALVAGMERNAEGWRTTSERLVEALSLRRAEPDARIEVAVRSLLAAPGKETDAAGIALRVGLSSSRFQHLFKEATGVSFRRFRLWARMRAALAAVTRGVTLTHAAHATGFSSSAHLSCAFKEMFGMAPTRLLAGAPLLIETP